MAIWLDECTDKKAKLKSLAGLLTFATPRSVRKMFEDLRSPWCKQKEACYVF